MSDNDDAPKTPYIVQPGSALQKHGVLDKTDKHEEHGAKSPARDAVGADPSAPPKGFGQVPAAPHAAPSDKETEHGA